MSRKQDSIRLANHSILPACKRRHSFPILCVVAMLNQHCGKSWLAAKYLCIALLTTQGCL